MPSSSHVRRIGLFTTRQAAPPLSLPSGQAFFCLSFQLSFLPRETEAWPAGSEERRKPSATHTEASLRGSSAGLQPAREPLTGKAAWASSFRLHWPNVGEQEGRQDCSLSSAGRIFSACTDRMSSLHHWPASPGLPVLRPAKWGLRLSPSKPAFQPALAAAAVCLSFHAGKRAAAAPTGSC